MANWKRKLELSLYDSAVYKKTNLDIRQETAIVSKTIEITYAKLCVATAKSILTNAHTYSPSIINFARSYFHTIPFLLTEKNGYLVFDYKNKDVLRDFSKSTRIGELAQGINYHICFNVLDAYAVYDYKDFVRNIVHIKSKIVGQTPDFVLCYKDGTYGILESKGTMEANPTPFLMSGKKQFEDGCNFLKSNKVCIKNGYTSAISFATSSKRMKRNTMVYMADPENDEIQHLEISYKDNVLRECAKYLCLAGKLDLANEFKKGTSAISEIRNNIEEYMGERNAVIGSFSMISEQNEKVNIEMGFSEQLMQYIWNDENDKIIFESYIEGNTEFFSDGTFLRIR